MDPTIEAADAHAADGAAGAAVEPARCRAQLVEGSGPHLSGETRRLLRSRLRTAALMLLMGFGVFLVLSLAMIGRGAAPRWDVLAGHAAVTVVLAICAAALCRRCGWSMRWLRIHELIVFGAPAAFFLYYQAQRIREVAEAKQYFPNPVGAWIILIFCYGMFIPNTWRRAAVAIGALAAAPVLLTGYLWATDEACAMCLAEDAWLLLELALMMGVVGVASVVGVHTINTLRREAFEAKLLGQYRLRRRIGAGGMGEVYLAEHQMMKRPCAIKLIRPEMGGDPRTIARFEREVRTSASLSHWNNIDIYDYGRTDDGTFYYVMEFLPGLDLGELVRRYGPLPPERAIYLLTQVCAALGEAHGKGLIHRDIKPANVFAARRGGMYDVVKVLDFGLAKPVSGPGSVELTQEGVIAGSPLFMSPEQATGGGEPDARSDIYSVGALAYYLLTGRPPFDDQRPIRVIMRHAHEQPAPPSQLRGDVPADLEQVVLKCLAKRPEDRYQSVRELAEALRRCQAAGRWGQEEAARWWRDRPMCEAPPCPPADGEAEERPAAAAGRLPRRAASR